MDAKPLHLFRTSNGMLPSPRLLLLSLFLLVLFPFDVKAEVQTNNYAQYSIKNADGKYCFLMNFTASFTFTYKKKDQNSDTKKFSNLPWTVVDASNCSGNSTTLILTTQPENAQDKWTLEFQFFKIGTSKTSNGTFHATSAKMTLMASSALFPDIEESSNPVTITSAESWGNAPVSTYYHCMAPKILKFAAQSPINGLDMRLSDVMLEAFVEKKQPNYSNTETLCTEDQVPDNTVPIAVGSALAVCIVIALIVFIVFNRRNRRHYGSVWVPVDHVAQTVQESGKGFCPNQWLAIILLIIRPWWCTLLGIAVCQFKHTLLWAHQSSISPAQSRQQFIFMPNFSICLHVYLVLICVCATRPPRHSYVLSHSYSTSDITYPHSVTLTFTSPQVLIPNLVLLLLMIMCTVILVRFYQ